MVFDQCSSALSERLEEHTQLKRSRSASVYVQIQQKWPLDPPKGVNRMDLHVAVSTGEAAEIKRLLDEGVNVNVRNKDGQTPLHCAAEVGDVECAEVLVAAGANINARDKCDYTPFFLARERVFKEDLLGSVRPYPRSFID